ncbi:hypothetical protein L195_g059272, partial [Trifolium pratense]
MYDSTVQKFSVERKGLSITIFLPLSSHWSDHLVDWRKSKSTRKACSNHADEGVWTLIIPLVRNDNIINNHS